MLYQIIIASLVGSIFALIGGIILLYKESFAKKISLILVSFAAGSLIGVALLDLLPEALELSPEDNSIFISVIVGILALFIFEKWLHWYHCHDREVCEIHTFSTTVLFGDAIHNFIDGIIIALSFSISAPVGIAATIAVFFHEVPQEIGDFGVLLHAGYSRTKVFVYNMLTALTTLVGALIGYFLLPVVETYLPVIIAFAAGSFIYIAVSDLLPELRHHAKGKGIGHVVSMLLGIAIIILVGAIFPE